MARTSVGAVTIMDVIDGINPISMVLSNQSHTFAADNAGVVSAAERGKFSCEVFVYLGETRATYDNTLSSNFTYSVAVTDPSGWASNVTDEASQAVIRTTSIPTGTTNNTGIIDLVITVRNGLGNNTVINAAISLAKAIEGAGGAIITVTPNRQTFRFDEAGSTNDGDITITVTTQGNVGALSAYRSINGGTFGELNEGTGPNSAKAIDIDGAGSDSIVISAANFDDSDTMAIEVRGTGTQDTVSLIRIQDGFTGAASISVIITSSVGGFQFKNNAGAVKTLTATTYDSADGSIINAANLTYQWFVDGGLVSGANSPTITVSPSDIPNGGSELYSCTVTEF